MVMVFAFTAFAVDVGYIALSKSQLQKSADAAALAAVIEMADGWGAGASKTPAQVQLAACVAARDVAGANEAGGLKQTYLNPVRDIRLGQLTWNATTQTWEKHWGQSPYNLVEATVHRDQSGSSNGDGPLDLFFAPVIGSKHANVQAVSTSAMLPGVGLRRTSGLNIGILPYALDVETWDAMLSGVGSDNYHYNTATGEITSKADGILEVDLYPYGPQELSPGNRGTVNIGRLNNSMKEIARQILYGLNEEDLEPYGGEFRFDDLPMMLNGNTGLSAGVKDELESIKGQPRLIPLFSDVSGPGNNAWYTIERFVPIRILYVQLTGKPASKRVVVQPAPYVSATVIPGKTEIVADSIFAPAGLIP